MDKARKGDVALAVLKYRLMADGILLGGPNFNRELGSMAKALKLDLDELKCFVKEILGEMADELLTPKEDKESEKK